MQNDKIAHDLDRELATLKLEERMALIAERFSTPVFTTSLGMEDQVLTWAISMFGRPIRIVTLQTGRLFAETLALLDITRGRYNVEIAEYEPETDMVKQYAATYGINGFYESIEARKACCHIRKIRPLEKALEGADAWITGLRREQSQNRNGTPMAEWDEERGLMKLNPLADWSARQIQETAAAHEIPVNPLHARNYPSIGCEPCTRAIKPGEHERAGRWWWERDEKQECGLHVASAPATTSRLTLHVPENA